MSRKQTSINKFIKTSTQTQINKFTGADFGFALPRFARNDKSRALSKKFAKANAFVLSLALASTLFTTEAQADWQGPGVTCSGKDCQKTGDATSKVIFDGANQENLNIMQGAKITIANPNPQAGPSHAIYVGQNWNGVYNPNAQAGTLTNNGTVETTGARGGNLIYLRGSIQGIVNNGTMVWSGSHNGITAQDYTGTMNMVSFTNTGTIGSASSQFAALYLGTKNGALKLQTFRNSGTMQAGGYSGAALRMANGSVLTNFTNSGTMSGQTAAIELQSRSKITNFYNDTTGNINKILLNGGSTGNTGTTSITQLDNLGQIGNIQLLYGTINTLTNSGAGAKIDEVLVQYNSTIGAINVMQGAEITTLSTRSSGMNNANITIANAGSKIGTLQNSNGGTLGGTITVQDGGRLDNVINASTMNANITNNTTNSMNVSNSGTYTGSVTSQGAVNVTNTSNMSGAVSAGGKLTVQNSGQLTGQLTSNNMEITNTAGGTIGTAINTQTLKLTNAGTINQTITAANAGGAKITNATGGTISGAVNVMQGAEILNDGTISGTITGNTLSITNTTNGTITQNVNTQNLTLNNSGNLTNDYTATTRAQITNTGTMSGSITAQGNNNTLSNAGTMSGAVTANNANITNADNATISGTVSVSGTSQITNAGTINNTLTNTSGTVTIDNQTDASIKALVNTTGTMNVNNDGEISEGIKVNGGVMNLRQLSHNAQIGRDPTSNAQIETSGGGRANVDGYVLGALEFSAAERANALQYKGDAGALTLTHVIVNGAVDTTNGTAYDSNTFVNNVDSGAFVGNDTNGGAGVNVNEIKHLSGLYQFSAATDKGKGWYRVGVDKNQLSGGTISGSSVFSSRFRTITVANIVRSLPFKSFELDENATIDKDMLALQRREEDNIAFAYGYLGLESIRVEAGRVDGYIRGLMGGVLKNLRDDKGVLGAYVGYDNADRDSKSQHLTVEERTKYAGLSYYRVLKRKGDDEYYMHINSRLDFGKIGADKLNEVSDETASTSYRNFGFNVNAKVGANYADEKGDVLISPEVGLNYQSLTTGAFSFHHTGGTTEHYDRGQMHFIDAIVAVNVKKPVNEKVRFNGALGTMINLYEHANNKMSLYQAGGTGGTGGAGGAGGAVDTRYNAVSTVATSKWYAYTQAGVSWSVTPDIDVSLNYSGVLGENHTYSHNVYSQIGLWW